MELVSVCIRDEIMNLLISLSYLRMAYLAAENLPLSLVAIPLLRVSFWLTQVSHREAWTLFSGPFLLSRTVESGINLK